MYIVYDEIYNYMHTSPKGATEIVQNLVMIDQVVLEKETDESIVVDHLSHLGDLNMINYGFLNNNGKLTLKSKYSILCFDV